MSNINIENFMKKLTPEYLKELEKTCYEDDRKYPENFSNWYSCIKSFGNFRHSKIIANQIFTLEEVNLMQKEDRIKNINWEDWYPILKPTLEKMNPNQLYSIKNGCFSNKFDFQTCITTKDNLAENLFKINYESAMLETGGYTELVVRELIPYDNLKVPTIYNGMPLREEIRVFYNMDTKEIEYFNDYWDYEYCINNLPNKNDQIIFNWFHNKLRTRHEQHTHEINVIKDQIKKNIHTLKIEGLTGIWSIDFMLVRDNPKYNGLWLIDMARAFRSAYWNPSRLKPETRKLLNNKNKENKNG